MKAYAVRGVEDWLKDRHAMSRVHDRARHVLGKRLAQTEQDAKATIDAIVNTAAQRKFIPMPNRRPRDIQYSFFMPVPDQHGTAFDLLIFCHSSDCLGFRFEPADPRLSTHYYGHIQMNRLMDGGSLSVAGLPGWVPTSYPAFPLRTSEPIEIFLSMIASIHGYPKFMDGVLQIASTGTRQQYAQKLRAAML